MPSVVRCKPCKEIGDCKIDGYTFKWLVTSADYIKAGQEMCNCLGETYQPVVVIKSKENYVAAISLDTGNHKIIQSALSKNYPIYNNSPVFSAIEKWCERYNVEWPQGGEGIY